MTEITLTEAYDRLVAIARANAKNSETLLRLAEALRQTSPSSRLRMKS